MLADSFYKIVEEKEIQQGEFLYGVRINPEHEIYKAHFPGYPITPGVCIIKIATELLGLRYSGARLSCADNVKFLTPLFPDKDEVIVFSFKERGEGSFGVTVSGNQAYSKMKIGILVPKKD